MGKVHSNSLDEVRAGDTGTVQKLVILREPSLSSYKNITDERIYVTHIIELKK